MNTNGFLIDTYIWKYRTIQSTLNRTIQSRLNGGNER
jgi:hypothetical protein